MYVRTTCPFPQAMERLANKLQGVSYLHMGDVPHHPAPVAARFNIYAERLRFCKKWYDSRVKAENEPLASQTTDAAGPMNQGYDFQDGLFDGLDDSIWQELMPEWPGPVWSGV